MPPGTPEITVYKYTPLGDLPDLSPFCIKLETWLRMAKIPFRAEIGDPRKAPKKKLPYIAFRGGLIPDSSAIIAHLDGALDVRMDERLDARQRAIAQAVRAMLEEHYYFCTSYLNWQDEAGFRAYRPYLELFADALGVPRFVRPALLWQARRKMAGMLYAQGTGRHTRDEVVGIGARTLDALAELLGEGTWFFGSEPATVDATVYAFLARSLFAPFETPLAAHIRTRPNLVRYCEGLRERVFGGGARPVALASREQHVP